MACFRPLKGWLGAINSNGKNPVVFDRTRSPTGVEMVVPCGQCVGCRLQRSKEWAIRCMHEASLYQDNCFITLTYNDFNLPPGRSLYYPHFQLFMKRLRFKMGANIRFYMCGEYGEKLGRPHYHALLFNCDFPDKYKWRKTKTGFYQYRSDLLESLWPYGNCEIGTVTFQSAAYVARYIMKKVTGDGSVDHYSYIDPNTGEVFDRVPEFNNMSRKPGIAKAWFDSFHASDVAPFDRVVFNNREHRPPRYYDKQFELTSPVEYRNIVRARRAKRDVDNQTPDRLNVREQVAQARLDKLVRVLT